MGFWASHVLKSTREFISDEELEIQHQRNQMWKKFKLHLIEHLKICMTIVMYGFAVTSVLGLLIAIPGFAIVKIEAYKDKVKLEASMQSSNTICLPRNQKE